MAKEVRSFQENIRRTFIRFSIVPVAAIVMAALILFVFSWLTFMASSNEQENKAASEEIAGKLDVYCSMVDKVASEIKKEDYDVSGNDVFRILYECTSEYGDIGNLLIMSPSMEALFSSKDHVPSFLTQSEYSNWGIWNVITTYKGQTKVTLYSGNLCVSKGIYEGGRLQAAVVYIIPKEVMSSVISNQNRYVIITDKHGWVYTANTRGLQDEFGQIDNTISSEVGFVKLDGNLYYSYRTELKKGLIVYTVNDVNRSVHLIWAIIAIITVIFLAIALITVKSTAISSVRYTKDIKKIEDAFEEVKKGKLDVNLDIHSSKEFQTIGDDFNEMLEGLKEQIGRNKELAENVAFSQVKQLESQFNPHFIFNTLDNIRFMARIDAAAADKMIVSLSGLLRYSIKEVREEVTVKEDLDHLQYYLNILQIRFNKRFAYSIEVQDDIMDCLIPKLLIQPLLENAVKYGFNGQEKLTVSIRGYQMQEKLIFICEDDGAGIDEELLEEIRNNLKAENNTSSHYGIYNIHRRIGLMYNGDFGLDISSKKNEGTLVRITVPKRVGEEKII
ncbi:sensor histidine kinase [Butyrivibrio sp. INlla21]|uniref:sensor histidine kinase n=1 Tax=Butyrivibrio sp. INlla21 TaxID=1520811 RepID=UPI0008EAE238|nr:sensor histidine kinase [Butyrivibrio sp. INlla21]SFU49112.1 Histidine kinase-, DNA gyrase B-, and HSP90-like ATPase [Butyrivibrio sp. INlla21]